MDTACLAHVLTEEERSTFDRDGYFVIEGALSPEQVQHFVAGVDAVDARYRLEHGLAAEERLNPHDTIGYDERFLLLIDWPTTFPKVWGILG